MLLLQPRITTGRTQCMMGSNRLEPTTLAAPRLRRYRVFSLIFHYKEIQRGDDDWVFGGRLCCGSIICPLLPIGRKVFTPFLAPTCFGSSAMSRRRSAKLDASKASSRCSFSSSRNKRRQVGRQRLWRWGRLEFFGYWLMFRVKLPFRRVVVAVVVVLDFNR